MMTDSELQLLKADFIEWSGGFEPESEEDIKTYIEFSMSSDLDEGEVAGALRQWMLATLR